jgi:hypothetical protein
MKGLRIDMTSVAGRGSLFCSDERGRLRHGRVVGDGLAWPRPVRLDHGADPAARIPFDHHTDVVIADHRAGSPHRHRSGGLRGRDGDEQAGHAGPGPATPDRR